MPEIRLPAEWELHSGTWLSWPHRDGRSFPGDTVNRVFPAMLEIVSALARSERVMINVRHPLDAEPLRDLGTEVMSQVRQIPISTNEPWCRDHGPVFVESPQSGAVCWEFNAWGKKYEPYDDDARAAGKMAAELEVAAVPVPHVFEGGMLDSNGAGVALVSEPSMLDPKRNPGFDRSAAEALFAKHLGIKKTIWLSEHVPGDDTDGHVDTYARFVAENRVAVCLDPLGEAYQRVADAIAAALPQVEIVSIPPPPRIVVHDVEVPATYANFYIANGNVLLPVFDVPEDARATSILADLFPTRGIIPIDCREIVWALGAIHCLTCPIPASSLPSKDFGEY